MKILTEQDVEDHFCATLCDLGWAVTPGSTLDRPQKRDVVLVDRLRAALARLNPDVPSAAREDALRELIRDRAAMPLANANRDLYGLLRDGVKVEHRDAKGATRHHTVRAIDWNDPSRGDFVLVRQLQVTGAAGTFIPDLVGYVNGLPLVVIELKDVGVTLDVALTKNIDPYRAEVPQLFTANALVMLSNGVDTRVGSVTGQTLEHFARWTRLTEGGERRLDVETVLRAVLTPQSFLDLVENFLLFEQSSSGLRKLVAQNHQRLGVDLAFARVAAYGAALDRGDAAEALTEARRLGVFWHTQGSGKSYSMALLVRKVLRKLPGDWRFVVVTDRDDLDDQICGNFVATGAAGKKTQARSAKDLRRLLEANERVVFTLIQKFRVEDGASAHPVVSSSPRVIVLADEAHRSQYDTFATNMRRALPGAAFMAFTGTPLLGGDTSTRARFGEYVSRYPFFAAIEDGATVPLYYEATLPDLQLGDRDLDAAMGTLATVERLTAEEQRDVEAHFSRQYILLTRSSRLDKVAAHLVDHLLGLAPTVKAMAVCIDRATTLRLAQRVEKVIGLRRMELTARLDALDDHGSRERRSLAARLEELAAFEWAVVVSREQGDTIELARSLRYHARGIVAYAKKVEAAQRQLAEGLSDVYRGDVVDDELLQEAAREAEVVEAQDPLFQANKAWVERVLPDDVDGLADRFKDADDPLRLVFVCSMWITGFDAPPCGVVYLDRPMANHTLMQTIARANRVFPGKDYGRVLDYVGVLRNLERAFQDYEHEYASEGPVDRPVVDITREVERLAAAIRQAKARCEALGVDLGALATAERVRRTVMVADAVEQFAAHPTQRDDFRREVAFIDRLYRALGSHEGGSHRDPYALDHAALCKLSAALGASVDAPRDLQRVLAKLDEVLDEAMEADVDEPAARIAPVDLATIDLAALAQVARSPRPNTAAAAASAVVLRAARAATAQNPTLLGLQRRVEDAIAAYTQGAINTAALLGDLIAAGEQLRAEEGRAAKEGLERVELATFDLALADLGEDAQKEGAREGLKAALRALRALRPGRDWRATEQKLAAVRVAIRDAVEGGAGAVLDEAARERLRAALFTRIYDTR
jgi:type I restriction enzyme R subunit